MNSDEPSIDEPRDQERFQGVSSWLVSAIIHLVLLLVLALLVIPAGNRFADQFVLDTRLGGEAPEPLFTLGEEEFELPDTTETVATVEPVDALQIIRDANLTDPGNVGLEQLKLASTSAALDAKLGGDKADKGDAMFFGTSASGRSFVFILDISGSMSARNGERFFRARDELLDSVSRLREDQEFYVYLFNWSTFPMFGPAEDPEKLIPANGENISRLRAWLYSIRPHSGTDPRGSLIGGHAMKPDAIFLLSDGSFNTPPRTDLLRGWDGSRHSVFDVMSHPDLPQIQLNTIAFEDRSAAGGMSKLAEMTDGQFRFVPAPGQIEESDLPPDAGPEYTPQTKEDRLELAENAILLRRAERLAERGRDRNARELVKDIDPARLPKTLRARLAAIRR